MTSTPTQLCAPSVTDLPRRRQDILGIGASGPQVNKGFHRIPFDSSRRTDPHLPDDLALVHEGRQYQVPLSAG
jgi:hypothetical protein